MASIGSDVRNFFNNCVNYVTSRSSRVADVAIPVISDLRIPLPKLLLNEEIQAKILKNKLYWATFSEDGTIFLTTRPIAECENLQLTYRLLPKGKINSISGENIQKGSFPIFNPRKMDVFVCYHVPRPKNIPYVPHAARSENYYSKPEWQLEKGAFLEDSIVSNQLMKFLPTEQVNLQYMVTIKNYQNLHTAPTELPLVIQNLIKAYIFAELPKNLIFLG